MFIEILTAEKMVAALSRAIQQRTTVTLTVRHLNRWISYRTRLMGIRRGEFAIDPPIRIHNIKTYDLTTGQRVEVSFRLSNERHFFTTRVTQVAPYDGGAGGCPALAMELPDSMQKISSRTHYRADIPEEEIVRASIWPGGMEMHFSREEYELPLWSGRVLNLSVGGFQIRIHSDALAIIRSGDVVGTQVSFPSQKVTLWAEGHVCNISEQGGEMVLFSVRFADLRAMPDGREAEEFLSEQVNRYRRNAQPVG